MRVSLYVLLAVTCVSTDQSEDRRSKLPFVADAVGNKLPPPSNVPATVGSPVNLLTPDRYEFYTFDESGELVKRLMTLEEIQAIVAAGEETEGLVTFANDNHPTIAFNFSQPPYTKVHNVVTNVQNVLKAQMEAHKNKPHIQPTLDTPDVSDSWSLILPSIFGNTGVDIVPDKTSGTFTTPETETIDLDRPIDDNSLSKEGTNQIFGSTSTVVDKEIKQTLVTDELSSTTVKSNAIHKRPTTQKPTTTTIKPSPITTRKPLSTTTTTISKPTTTTTKATTSKVTTTTSTTSRPRDITTTRKRTTFTTSKPHTTTTTTTTSKQRITNTAKPAATTKSNAKTTQKVTTPRPLITKKHTLTTQKNNDEYFTKIQIQTVAHAVSTTDKTSIHYEKISTFVPMSTAAYVEERTTKKPEEATKSTAAIASTTKISVIDASKSSPTSTSDVQLSVTTYKPSVTFEYMSTTPKKEELEKINATTITTQSVSPSTAASSTEFISIGNHNNYITSKKPAGDKENNDIKDKDDDILLFDVAQSISQIASDLGGNNYQPIPTTGDLLDTTKLTEMDIESKENIEIDIPADVEKVPEIKTPNSTVIKTDNFVKISTVDPYKQNANKSTDKKEVTETENLIGLETTQKPEMVTKKSDIATEKQEITTNSPVSTTIDPVLSESMEDLLSQVVNSPQSIVDPEMTPNNENKMSTTKIVLETTTNENVVKLVTTEESVIIEKENSFKIKESSVKSKNMTNIISSDQLSSGKDTESMPTKSMDYENKTTHKNDLNKSTENNQDLAQISPSYPKTNSIVKLPSIENRVKPTIVDNITKIESIMQSTFNNFTYPKTDKYKEPISISSNPKIISDPLQNLELFKKPVHSLEKPEKTFSKSDSNKILPPDMNKLTSYKEKEKVSESFPKIDEFKKKIQKVNIDEKELVNERNNSWKLISTVSPPKANEIPKDKHKTDTQEISDKNIVLEFSKENQGLEVTTKDLGNDIAQFTELCNELAFRYWNTIIENVDKKRSFVLSPFSITSMLAMMFMGARGATSGEMNEILKLDDMVTFNPHFTLKNISDSIETTPESGVIVSAFIRELFSDRSRGKILTFYKERAQHFYNGHVEEVNFKLISDIIRRRTNLLVKRYSWGRIMEYMKANTITMQPPLAAFSANIFQTDCSGSSVEGRDGEMYFVVSPNVRQRRLVPVPAVVYRNGFLAGYDPVLDATAAALGNTNSIVSTLFLMPGQQGNIVHADDLEALEKRLLDSNPTTPAWNRLLRTLLPRIGLELQIPRFSHKSIFNVSSTLKTMGLKDLFDAHHADLGGLNGPSKDLYLSDMVQSTAFVTCGEDVVGEQHHIEEYPEFLGGPQRRRTSRWATGWDEPRDYQRAFHDPHDVGEAMHLPLHLRPRQARLPARNAQPARLKFDRPFLYFVRHNPSGMILYVGRYNPRLLP